MNDMTVTTGTALTVLPAASLPTILAADDQDILGKLAAELSAFDPDVTTVKGRAEIASKAHKVATAKMDLIRLGKSLTEGWRQSTKAVNEECKTIEERMDALKDRVRAPLDEYQAREKTRVENHEAALREIVITGACDCDVLSSAQIGLIIDNLSDLHAGRQWEEFGAKANKARQDARETLRAAYQRAKTHEDEAEAQAAREAEEAERQRLAAIEAQRLREEQIAAEAAERATREAEEAADRKAEEARKAAQAALDAAEGERLAGVERERLAAEELAAAAERERAVIEAIERGRIAGHRDALEALREHPEWGKTESSAEIARRGRYLLSIDRDWEEFAAEAADVIESEVARARVLLDAAMARETEQLNAEHLAAEAEVTRRQDAAAAVAIEAERARVARGAEAQRVADERRAADVAHRGKINREALAAVLLVMRDRDDVTAATKSDLARKIVEAIAKGQIAHVYIKY